ncbi:unnamed protein product [marine sediment metagenome]|uniref:Glycosyltransferase 2-like domain-containing protein n=1 Tax=marine sediment metagenome TaxID=412755 RepID=X1PUZ9_9ZZZZ
MTILERQISILNEYHVNPIKVVIGKEGTCWDKTIIEQIREIHNDLVINDDNLNTGPAYSCKLAMNSMEHEHTLIIDGDVVFEPTVIFELSGKDYASCYLELAEQIPIVSKRFLDDDSDFKIIKGFTEQIAKWVELCKAFNK